MHDLNEATHENVGLAVLFKTHALDIDRVDDESADDESAEIPNGDQAPGVPPDLRLPLHATAVGKILLAYAPEAFIQQVMADGLQRYTCHTIVNAAALQRDLVDIRRAGLSFACGELVLGRKSVAAPVFDTDGLVVAAMSLVLRSARSHGPAPENQPELNETSRADLRRLQGLGPAVKTAAFGVTRALRSGSFSCPKLPA